MTSRFYIISEELKQAARQARSEPASGLSPSAKTLIHLDDKDPTKVHQHAKTEDLKTDTKLKKVLTRRFIGTLIGQLLVMNRISALIGAKLLHFGDFVINLFMGGTLAEVSGTVLVMAHCLFSKHI